MKKILVVDDSALMRRVLCDIINNDERFKVIDTAANGREALELLKKKSYDAVVLDVNMPEMTGLQLLEELNRNRIPARVMMASTDTREGAQVTLRALELGALDFMHKPSAAGLRLERFSGELLRILDAVASAKLPVFTPAAEPAKPERRQPVRPGGDKIVAIASSTGGPKALQSVIPRLPGSLDAPVLLVQHMPKGFTASLADRLNDLSEIRVKEAEEGEEIKKGVVYIAAGGLHMSTAKMPGGREVIRYLDEPAREGVKPCANYMFESLVSSRYDQAVCVVMTGMGADGTAGIRSLKKAKQVYTIGQDRESCVVYGMPKSLEEAALSDKMVPLEQIAREIVMQVGTI